MNYAVKTLIDSGFLTKDFDYHLLRASMVVIFFFFGYQKWFEYEAQALIPFISNGPLISWLYPAFGIRGASRFIGTCEWSIGALLLFGFWEKRLGLLGAMGSTATFITTITIIPFMPNGWVASAGGFPAMGINVAFLMKDVGLLAVSVYLLKQDALRVFLPTKQTELVTNFARSRKGIEHNGEKASCRPRIPLATLYDRQSNGVR